MKKAIAVIALFTLAGYVAWGRLTRPLGDQKVHFTPASKERSVDGPLSYCVYRASGGVNGDVVYHLHGRNLDEGIWNDDTYFTSMVQAQWEQARMLPPTVVTVSYGPVWLLTPKGGAKESGLLDDFMERLPRIEAKIGAPRRRMLVGESMGGLNALILGLTHPTLFAKVASLSPGVYAHTPFASFSELRNAAARTGADPKIILGVIQLARKFVQSEAEWNRISPLQLIETPHGSLPDLYLSCGLYDKYGNFEGTRLLAEKATSRGVKTAWHPIYGGHGAIDVASLANFLVNP